MFSIILPGRPWTSLQPVPNSPNQFTLSFPLQPHFSHIVIFLSPGTILPDGTAAAVYLQFPGQEFRFLGAIANEKQSAIFRVNLPTSVQIPADSGGLDVNVGVSVENTQSIQQQLSRLQSEQQSHDSNNSNSDRNTGSRPSTKLLAQRIIKNAFNFLAGFSGRVGDNEGGVEVVPLKSFEDWWRKFERRVELDPGFLERDDP